MQEFPHKNADTSTRKSVIFSMENVYFYYLVSIFIKQES